MFNFYEIIFLILTIHFFQNGNVTQNRLKFFLKFFFLSRGQIYSGQFRQFFNFHVDLQHQGFALQQGETLMLVTSITL